MQASQKCKDLIKKFEGLRLTPYRDAVGILTVGYGHTGSCAQEGKPITKAMADALFETDLLKFENDVNDLVMKPLTQGQYDALVSFTYNLGREAFAESTMLRGINSGLNVSTLIKNWFPKFIHAGKEVLQGLVNRRYAEIALMEGEDAATT